MPGSLFMIVFLAVPGFCDAQGSAKPATEDLSDYLGLLLAADVAGGLNSSSPRDLTMSNAPPSFFVELQRRFPFTAPLHGDTRVVMGLMIVVCNHCGLD